MAGLSTPSSYTVSRHTRTLSPPSATSTVGPQMQRLNIVTRLAIEGSAKKADSVAIKMYLKLALPADSIIPGSAIPLFKEEDVKIVDSEVHPLDASSVPYHFSSTASPLLHNAARALNLPARSPNSYTTLFGGQPTALSRYSSVSSSSKASDVPRLEEQYTGHILVTGYQVSFVLPKEFPPKSRVNGRLDEESQLTPLPLKLRSRRGSIGDKSVVLFMAGISMMVPYVTKPQRAPWLLSIPTPRCLSNHLKLRIFPPNSPTSISTSTQSLSSAEADSDNPTWDMTADPHVTRASNNTRRSAYQYQHFADDESSDSSSPGFSDGVGIQGTFPSSERIRVRWAIPVRNIVDGKDDGRRRVGVTHARADMVCTVLGRGRDRSGTKEGVIIHLEYKGSCQGVWYPGVATLLGMDVGLQAKGCDVSWARGHDAKWTAVGGPGFTGADVNGQDLNPRTVEKQTSFDMPQLTTSSSPIADPVNGQAPSRQSSTSSTTPSLLRAPLPSEHVPEYSFESGPTTPSETGMSSILSTTDGESRQRSRASSVDDANANLQPPSSPITLHLNINDLLPPSKNVFAFSVSGVILVTPRVASPVQLESPEASEGEDGTHGVVSLPRFRILAADTEKIDMTVRNGVDTSLETVDLYSSTNPKARELVRGDRAKIGFEEGRIAVRALPQIFRTASPFGPRRDEPDPSTRPMSRPRTPDPPRIASTSALRDNFLTTLKPRRDGPLMLPYVDATVTPLVSSGSSHPQSYAVRVVLPAPADADTEWFYFGLGRALLASSPATATAGRQNLPRVEVVSASLNGIPIKHEPVAGLQAEKGSGSALPFQETSGREWVTWVRLHTGAFGGGQVEFTYIVTETEALGEKPKQSTKGKGRVPDGPGMGIMLPTFNIPIGRLQVEVEPCHGFDVSPLHSNLTHRKCTGNYWRLFDYHIGPSFYTEVKVQFAPVRATPTRPFISTWGLLRSLMIYAPILLSLGYLAMKLASIDNALATCRALSDSDWDSHPPMVTIIPTVIPHTTSPPPVSSTPTTPDSSPQATEPPSVTLIDISATSSSPQSRPIRRGGTSPYGERAALLSHFYPLQWRIKFEIPFTRTQVTNAVWNGLGSAWRIMKWAYHYPVSPPENSEEQKQ